MLLGRDEFIKYYAAHQIRNKCIKSNDDDMNTTRSAMLRASIQNSDILHIIFYHLNNLGILFQKIDSQSDILSITQIK